jgi:hypothetical protein
MRRRYASASSNRIRVRGRGRGAGHRLNAARSVTLFCGAGVRGAHAEVMQLAASRIVLDGGVGRMLDLARANLRNIPR